VALRSIVRIKVADCFFDTFSSHMLIDLPDWLTSQAGRPDGGPGLKMLRKINKSNAWANGACLP